MSWALPLPVVVPLVAAAVLVASDHVTPRRLHDAISSTALAAACALSLVVLQLTERRDVLHWFGGWHPRAGVAIGVGFAADPLGAGMAALAFGVMTRMPPDLLGQYFLEHAYSGAGGTNAVNVILVDFRGFDTLGEITVLGAVALATYALLRRFRPAPDSLEIPEQQRDQRSDDIARGNGGNGHPVADWLLVPFLIGRLLFPVIGCVALFLLLRGHDLPGGGFVAGLTASVGLILQYMVGGTRWIEDRIRVEPLRWIGLGLLLALATGLAAWLFGRPFLTSYFGHADLPVIGPVPTASALLFDIGVFMLVFGATALILIALAHQSVRGHRGAPRQAAPRREALPASEVPEKA